MMSLHKLTAGDGYTYLTRQVATVDSTERGYSSLGDYYAAKGESPGVWIGAQAVDMGLAGTAVSEQQMKNLFGEGRHPDAERLEAEALAGLPAKGSQREKQRAVERAGKLGASFPVFELSPEWHDKLAAAYRTYNLDLGLDQGDPVPDEAKQAIRTRVATAMFTEQYGRTPQHDHELSGFIAQQSRPDKAAVAGYDLTFSPVKSVSTLWAIAPPEVTAKIEAAHQAAVAGTLQWLEKEAGYTREGAGSVSQIRIKGFLATAFTHRDSRAGDPDLHTHVAVSNKVQTPDGRWLALDARMLYRYNVPASEQYNLLLEKEVIQRVGGRFAPREKVEDGKREIRELVGVPAGLNEYFSSRAVMIEGRRSELIDQFRADHGRVPTAVERIQLSQQANLATRQAKHEPMSLGEQRAVWQSYPEQVCPDSPEKILADVVGQEPDYADLTPQLVSDLTGRVVQVVTESRAQWRDNNLSAEARRQVKAAGVHPGQMADLAEIVTTAAAGLDHSIPIGMDTEIDRPIPAALLDVDGKAVFRMAKGQLYTSPAILDAESRIVAAAGRTDAWAVADADVDIAHLEWSANNEGRVLNTGQLAMVREIATSGRRVQLVFGPAGTGKTTALAVLSRAVQSRGRRVVVLAPTAAAARVAGEAIPGVHADTLHKLAWSLRPVAAEVADVEADPASAAAAADEADKLAWVLEIGPDHLVIIDEAGLAGTRELDIAIGHITASGGRVLLVGDDRQRAANGAGGVLRDIESTHGALTLDEVMRFQDRGVPGAGALHGRATLALRHGDPGAAGYYADRDLIRAVTPDTAAEQVFTGWAADIAAGADSIMIAPTLDMVSELNSRARAARIAAAGTDIGPVRDLQRSEKVSAGDLIVTKKNKRVLSMGGTDFVRNNYRWTVQAVNRDGSITATEITRGVTRTLPAWYVDKGWVRLGYAHTEASVQGMTVGGQDRVGTAHVMFTETTNRNQLYTSVTRATDRTHLYGIVPGTGDLHEVTTPAAVTPETVVEMFAAVIGRDGSDRSATTTLREAADPALRLGAPGNAALAYSHAIVQGSLDLVGEQRMKLIADTVEVLVPGITSAPAWETLRGHLATIEACGGDPVGRLDRAAMGRELNTAADLAAVLDYRLDTTGNHSLGQGPLPYLPAMPAALIAQPYWDNYLPARAELVTDLARQVRDRAFGWTLDDAPAWAIPYLPDMDLVADLAVWRAAHAVPEQDLRPAGPRPLRLAARTWHTHFTDRAIRVAGDPAHGADRWKQLLTDQYHLDVAEDDWFPVLAARLTLADTAGMNVRALLAEAITDREPLPAQVPAKALWWRLEPHLGSLTDGHVLPSTGHRLRPAWTIDLQHSLGELDAERIMSDRLWPNLVAHIDRVARDGYAPDQVLPAAADLFTAVRPTLGAHEMATVLLWLLNMVTDPNPPDPDFETPYLDPQDQDLAAPAGAYQILDENYRRQAQTTTIPAPPAETGVSGVDPFDPDRYVAAAALVDAAYAELEHTEPEEEPPLPADVDVFAGAPPDLYDDAPAPARAWITPPADPPAPVADPVEPDVAPEPALPDQRRQVVHDRLYAANAAAWQYYRTQAPASWVPGYIGGRGLDPDLFGYAPTTYTALSDHLRHNGFTDTELVAAGLGTHSRRGEVIDRFRDRAVLPITTPDGRVASFIGRINPDHVEENPADYTAPKYVNGPTTDIFTKGDLPYGLNPTTVAALQAGADLVLVEGPMDAEAVNAAARTAGQPMVAIAPNGTALTAAHLQVLNQIAPLAHRQVIEAFDSDPAGRAAAGKAHTLLAQLHIHHADSVTGLTGKDAAQMLADTGPAGLHTALQQRRPLTDAALDHIIHGYDTADGTVESRYHAMRAVLPAIAALPRDQVYDQTVRTAGVIGWDPDRAITWVTDYLTEHPQPPHTTPEPGTPATATDLGLPTPPTLTTAPPHPRADPAPTPQRGGTLLLHPAIDDQPVDLDDPTDRELALAQLDDHIVALNNPNPGWEPAVGHPLPDPDDTAPADTGAPTVAPAVDTELSGPATATITGQERLEETAAAAWLQAADPDLYTRYLQVQATATAPERAAAAANLLAQYRNHTAAEAHIAEVAAADAPADMTAPPTPDTDVAATTLEVSERDAGARDAVESGDAGPFPDLPDEVLEEEIVQLTARHAESAQVAGRATELAEQIRIQIAQGRGSEVTQQRNQDQENQRRFAAMQQALEVSEAAEAARVRAAALGAQVMEAEQNLRDVTGAFAGRRRAEMTQRLEQVRTTHEQQREQMLNLGRRSHALTAELGTVHQQRQALALRDPDAYRAQLAKRLEQAQQRDLQEQHDAAEWASAAAVRHAALAAELAQMTTEQTRRAEHPDPAAEHIRRERYEELQAEEAGLALSQQGLTWDQDDLNIPGAPDNSIER